MHSDKDDSNDSWSKLKSISAFDRHTENNTTSRSTQIIGGSLIETVASRATTPVSLLVESLVQQLCTMLEPDPVASQRLYIQICQQLYQMNLIDSTYEMGEFELMRSRYQQSLYQLVMIAQNPDLPATLKTNWPLIQPNAMDWSRYYREFEELSYIAGGGFGKVYRARHKLDDTVYAIKKITIRSTDSHRVMTHFHEVKTMAALHHLNIVPYKAAWLEPLVADPDDDRNIKNTTISDIGDDSELGSQTVESNDLDESSDFIEFVRSEQPPETRNESAMRIPSDAICKFTKRKNLLFDKDVPQLKLKWAILYIQMALCQLTLREWLDRRNQAQCFDDFYRDYLNTTPQTSERKQYARRLSNENADADIISHLAITKNIMMQLFCGLEYIHSKGIIHHDIKPSNIFIGVENGRRIIVQLGDFGLACPLQHEHTEVTAGTPTYAAPEQLNSICDPKSDIYSLGIVLIELLVGFKTSMERSRTIEIARKGQFDTGIPSKLLHLIKCMLHYQPKKRPDIVEISEMMNQLSVVPLVDQQTQIPDTVKCDLNESMSNISITTTCKTSRTSEIQIKNEEIRLKDQQIEQLQTQIRSQSFEIESKDEEINRLKLLLNKAKTKYNSES